MVPGPPDGTQRITRQDVFFRESAALATISNSFVNGAISSVYCVISNLWHARTAGDPLPSAASPNHTSPDPFRGLCHAVRRNLFPTPYSPGGVKNTLPGVQLQSVRLADLKYFTQQGKDHRRSTQGDVRGVRGGQATQETRGKPGLGDVGTRGSRGSRGSRGEFVEGDFEDMQGTGDAHLVHLIEVQQRRSSALQLRTDLWPEICTEDLAEAEIDSTSQFATATMDNTTTLEYDDDVVTELSSMYSSSSPVYSPVSSVDDLSGCIEFSPGSPELMRKSGAMQLQPTLEEIEGELEDIFDNFSKMLEGRALNVSDGFLRHYETCCVRLFNTAHLLIARRNQ
ncbi:hypothetical protein H257_16024 [Aphanomyces astaci]|uniref:Uncharacterized protein n=1 Tax=Aphanomyces astaci TaxID=112090 RepID=W4FMH9_APHAT|nr:hypothetical protein H257_16024 [Aphanomyces astaci]ETV67903.1 hypothetical protein H257_16024 [Aphanomyces astaci]|eukprot:XP_009842648.1 hypothetical protein H257_16024 [Aphanomyces astaci]